MLFGEMKTWWTFELELFPVSSPAADLAELERPVGKRKWSDKDMLIRLTVAQVRSFIT